MGRADSSYSRYKVQSKPGKDVYNHTMNNPLISTLAYNLTRTYIEQPYLLLI